MTRRNLSEKHKKEIVKKAIELKTKYPELKWSIIVKRLNGVNSVRHLHNLIDKYSNFNYKKVRPF